jgi:hypothetical protein
MMDPVALRHFVYDATLSNGLPPSAARIARQFGVEVDDVKRDLAALRIGKTILVHPKSGEIWMAGPFAASPTPYRIVGANQSWWANCAWDMLGVALIAAEPVQLVASCCDCGEPFTLRVYPERGVDSDWLVHFLLPARRWYEDIGFT